MSQCFLERVFFWLTIAFLFAPLQLAIAQPFAYISNNDDDTISVVNTATNTVTATVPVGDDPEGVAVNPAGTRVYITNEADNTVSVIDAATNTVIATVPVGDTPKGVAVNPAGTYVYVTNEMDNNVSVIDATTNTVIAAVAVGNSPEGIAVSPAATNVYVANHDDDTVSVIDAATNMVTATVPVADEPEQLATNPAGTRVYVTSDSNNTVSVINTATNTVLTTIAVGNEPKALAINPAGTHAYVTNGLGNTLSVIDTGTNAVIATVAVGTGPEGIAINPAGTRVYVANHDDDTVSVIDTGANTEIATIAVGNGPVALGDFIGPETGYGMQLIGIATTLAGTPQPGDPITFVAQAIGPGTMYYKFLYRAGYGTAAYGTNPWVPVQQDFSTSNIATIAFPSADHYLVVVQGIDDLGSGFNFGDPQGGMTIKVQQAIQVTSAAFQQGAAIPVKYTCDGDNVSPPLAWSGIPEGTQSIALICDDPDAPGMIWVHWILFNLLPNTVELSENVPNQATLANGARHGINDSGNLRYNGPCPPPGTHRYYFKIYALDTMLDLQAGATKTELLNAMAGHILAEGELMGTYSSQ